MSWVYRARDARLRRDVAVKVLRESLALTPDHIERLAREARAVGGLSHPNIVVVFDVGTEGRVPYIVSELLEGESLRSRLKRGALRHDKALEYGVQIARGLAAAHDKGLWHRDIKPGNVFITRDGRIKLLDFGLVKHRNHDGLTSQDTTADDTEPGGIHGTLGYMSPEQLLGQPVDHRTDIFALGAVLYEMLTGVPAFHKGSAIETTRAVLNEEPPSLVANDPHAPPGVSAVVRRCLEKNRDERFQSASDLAFNLHQLQELAEHASGHDERGHHGWKVVLPAIGLAVAAAVGVISWERWRTPPPPQFKQLTYGRARIGGARFTSEGGVVYSEARQRQRRAGEGETLEVLWLSGTNDVQSRPLGYKGSDVLAAHAGKLALSVGRRFVVGERFAGTLAEAPIGEGRPRTLTTDIEDADWHASGRLVVVRCHGPGEETTLESPPGQVLYQTHGSIRFPRFSRDGRRIAFFEDASGLGAGGRIALVEVDRASAKPTELIAPLESAKGLAWSANGEEIWFTSGEWGSNRALRAVNLSGRQREVLPAAASWTLWDITPDGRILLTRDEESSALVGLLPGQASEQDLSLFDTTGLADVSEDGRTLLFDDRFGVYLRDTDGSPPVDLGLKPGSAADDLSTDGKRVLATVEASSRLLVIHSETGERTLLPAHGIASYRGAMWVPEQPAVVVNGVTRPRGPLRSYIQDLGGGAPRPLTPENTWATAVSPDGRWMATVHTPPQGPDAKPDTRSAIELWPIAGGDVRSVRSSGQGERAAAWSNDSRRIWVFRRGQVPANVYELDVETGRRTLWKTLAPADASGVYAINNVEVTPDGRLYFYSYNRVLSQLYTVTGLE
jgi:Tol biopolymer transport system component